MFEFVLFNSSFIVFCLIITVMNTMKEKFKIYRAQYQQLNVAGLHHQIEVSANKILYNHAVQMVC